MKAFGFLATMDIVFLRVRGLSTEIMTSLASRKVKGLNFKLSISLPFSNTKATTVYPLWKICYRGSPDSTVFAPPGNRTIEKTVLFGD